MRGNRVVGGRTDDGKRRERLCVAVDLEGYGLRTDAGQEQAQETLAGLLDAAWGAALPADQVERQPNGDGEVALLGLGAPAAAVVTMLAALHAGLRAVNRTTPPAERLRLRAAAHRGPARPARNGFAGQGVVRTCRLLGSRALRGQLVAQPGADLALAVSDPLFELVRGLLPAAEFRRVWVVEPAKVFSGWAWLHVGGALPEPADGLLPPPSAPVEPGMRLELADGAQVGSVVQARELHGGLTIGRTGPR